MTVPKDRKGNRRFSTLQLQRARLGSGVSSSSSQQNTPTKHNGKISDKKRRRSAASAASVVVSALTPSKIRQPKTVDVSGANATAEGKRSRRSSLHKSSSSSGSLEAPKSLSIEDLNSSSEELCCSDDEDNIRVVVRIRPFTESECVLSAHPTSCVSSATSNEPSPSNSQGVVRVSTVTGAQKQYNFDYVADQQCSQKDMFEVAGRPIADCVRSGFNGTLFCYGQTGAGNNISLFLLLFVCLFVFFSKRPYSLN